MEGLSEEAIVDLIGERLSKARLRRNWSQGRLAEESGVSVPTIKRMEAGKSSQLTNFVRVLMALDLATGFDALLPEPRISPLEALRLEGETRKRASRRGTGDADRDAAWSWGDGR